MVEREKFIEIETLRQKLGKEYEKCIDSGCMDNMVIEMSRKLDVLIVDYTKGVENCNKKMEADF